MQKTGVKRKRGGKLIRDSCYTVQLDARFRLVPHGQALKRFANCSKVSQWTGNKQKAMIQQLILVLAPILTPKASAAMHCA